MRTTALGMLGVATAFLGGCLDEQDSHLKAHLLPVSLLTTHAPAHPDTNQRVAITASATGQVDRITLRIQEFALSNGPSGPVQTPRGEERVLRTCDPDSTVPLLECAETLAGFPAASLIRVAVEAVSDAGEITREGYDFAAGSYPWPDEPIPIRVTGAPEGRLDLIFIPDTDITLASFRDQLDDVVRDRYFRYRAYAGEPGTPSGAMYNFYYSRVHGDIYRDENDNCRFTNPTNMHLLGRGDVIAFLHQTRMQDCRVGRRFGSEIGAAGVKSLIHESGHALFNLSDEYSGDTTYPTQACVPNIYRSRQACWDDAPDLGLPRSACVQLSGKNLWRIDAAGATGCIMGDAQYNAGSDHGVADRRRIAWRFGHCLDGNCYPAQECPLG